MWPVFGEEIQDTVQTVLKFGKESQKFETLDFWSQKQC